MRNRKRILSAFCAFLLMFALFVPFEIQSVYADDDNLIVVSMGDSYSSGEGIEPFYGQDKKENSTDWLAHRSEKSWPGLLVISGHKEMDGVNGITLKNYHTEYGDKTTDNCKWYFVASSGATTRNFKERQEKTLQKLDPLNNKIWDYTMFLDPQFDVFEKINKRIDYVTLTIGGNDVQFSSIIQDCVTGSSYLLHGEKKNRRLHTRIGALWNNIYKTLSDIEDVYLDIAEAAPYAEIIVAGYPELLNKQGKGVVVSMEEAETVNKNVLKFNLELKNLIEDLQKEGVHIHFVDVAKEFDGHQAYSKDAWISPVMYGTRSQDLKDIDISSAYSIHPNEEGAKAYARCVNKEIENIERNITGKAVDSQTNQPIEGAEVWLIDDYGVPNARYNENHPSSSNQNGFFTFELPDINTSYHLWLVKEGYNTKDLGDINVTKKTDIGTISLMAIDDPGETPDDPGNDPEPLIPEVQETITDSWDKIIASVNNGTYKDKYHIGDTKKIDLGSEGIVAMQIVDFDKDELADGNGKAAITWISQQLLKTRHRMNPVKAGEPEDNPIYYRLGTGSIGGWEYSEMRAWLDIDIKSLIPSNVRNAIKPVIKYSSAVDASNSNSSLHDVVTADEVWIPSYKEVKNPMWDKQGPEYEYFNTSNANLEKKVIGELQPSWWWLRTGVAEDFIVMSYDYRNLNWSYSMCNPTYKEGVALGFCM